MSDMVKTAHNRIHVASIGFGEAAQAFVSGWRREAPADVSAYDVKTDIAGPTAEAKRADYKFLGVSGHSDLEQAVAGADVVFSLVTADQAHAAAQAFAQNAPGEAIFLDCNSCAPQTKQRSSEIIAAAGGRYVDVAVMAPVHPKLHETPLLICGPHADAAMALLRELGMHAKSAGDRIGAASSIKLTRSIMVKGLEALAAECLLTASRLGVAEPVLASLDRSHPGFEWETATLRMLERMTAHGERRAAEMRESAAMIEAEGLPARMARATSEWQEHIGALGLPGDLEPEQRLQELLKTFDKPTGDA